MRIAIPNDTSSADITLERTDIPSDSSPALDLTEFHVLDRDGSQGRVLALDEVTSKKWKVRGFIEL
jgi:hypothetical protein